jgi:hypothetical protein
LTLAGTNTLNFDLSDPTSGGNERITLSSGTLKLPVPGSRCGRAGGIRTRGLFVPNEALYQAEPQPVEGRHSSAGNRGVKLSFERHPRRCAEV